MARQDDKKDELLKTPPASEQNTTPLGSSDQYTTPLGSSDQHTTPLGSSDASSAGELAPGRDFGGARLAGLSARYELEAELGRGGMGIVYRARDKETGERVALKVLKPEIANEQALLDRFKNELRLARKITHKHVCRTYELLRFGDTVVIAMEYVEGESLRAWLDRAGSLPLGQGLRIAQQVCVALHEAHAQGIVHRDLKPDNLMVDPAGNVKVMDFGIARSFEAGATATGSIIGTPAYMAPEQAEGKPVDARTDIYSLGLILYEMFTGKAAFGADTPVAVAIKQIREAPQAPREVEPTLPEDVEKAILKCLEKDPARRFQSVDELEAALMRGSGPTRAAEKAAGEVPPPVRQKLWVILSGKRRIVLLAMAAVVVAVVVVGGWMARESIFKPAPVANPAPAPNPDILRIASELRLHFRRAREALIQSGTGDFADAESDVAMLFRLDPSSGHAWYYSGELRRAKDQVRFTPKGCLKTPLARKLAELDAYHNDFYRYLEIEASLNPSETEGDDTGSEICYQREKGFCRQRTAWVEHLLAGDLYAAALLERDPKARREKLGHALKRAEAESKLFPPGFEQCTATKTLLDGIRSSLSAP